MKYRVLWVDDSPDWVAPIRESVKDYLEDLGFELVAGMHQDGSRVLEYLAQEEVDLIAVDYKLKGSFGDKIIEAIRNSDKFTEILFYTADDDYLNVLPPQDGVFRANRRDVEAKLRNLIGLALKRFQSPANMRGVVIAKTTDLEAILEEILVAQFGDKGGLFRDRVLHKKGIYDIDKKWALLMGLIKDKITAYNILIAGPDGDKASAIADKTKLDRLQLILSKFDKEVIHTRNILAHVKEQRDGNGRVMLKSINTSGEITIDHDWCVRIRKTLAAHRIALEELSGFSLV